MTRTCSASGEGWTCERPVNQAKFCQAHRLQMWRTGRLQKLRPRSRSTKPVDRERHRCCRCLVVKPLAEFPVDERNRNGHKGTCIECRHRDRRDQRYGEDAADHYQRMLDQQDGVCALCGSPDNLCMDHSHEYDIKDPRGRRGVLCRRCNLALGFIERYLWSPEGVDEYLARFA